MQQVENKYPVRKSPRIPRYDYGTVNSYFVTICTHEKKCIFYTGDVLNVRGEIVQECIEKISKLYAGYRVDKYVVMPNHIHAIITIDAVGAKELSDVIGQFKSVTAKRIRRCDPELQVWQRSFHDHVIRNQVRYDMIWNYIETNPLRWKDDCFYCK